MRHKRSLAMIMTIAVAVTLTFAGTTFFVPPQQVTQAKQNSNIIRSSPHPVMIAAKSSTTVYITRTGAKYHQETCRHLKKSKKAISLQVAKTRGYTPCKVCRPPKK